MKVIKFLLLLPLLIICLCLLTIVGVIVGFFGGIICGLMAWDDIMSKVDIFKNE